MGKYYKVKKEYAERAGLNAVLRSEVGDCLLLSEKDIRMIALTIEEKILALGCEEYVIESKEEEV